MTRLKQSVAAVERSNKSWKERNGGKNLSTMASILPLKRKPESQLSAPTWPFSFKEKIKRKKMDWQREIRKMQMSTNLILPKKGFQSLVKEIVQRQRKDLRFRLEAIMALQEASEAYLVQMFESSQSCASHAKRVTIMQRDVNLCLRLQQGYI